MKPEFWHDRWATDRIGFHQSSADDELTTHWPTLNLVVGSRVLVPLCGKSLDIVWLHQQGMDVVGVELSTIAVEAFFSENGLAHTIIKSNEHTFYVGTGNAKGITIVCGNLLTLTNDDLGRFDALYDRAAMIALPAAMLPDYTAAIRRFLKPNATGVILTVTYPQAERSGPPFSVTNPADHYEGKMSSRVVKITDLLTDPEMVAKFKVSSITETVYLITLSEGDPC